MTIATGQNIDPDDFINEAAADATPANDAGKAVKLESDGKIADFFLAANFKAQLTTYEDIDGSTTPVPVMIDPDGLVVTGKANNTNFDDFVGFITADVGATPGAYLGGTNGGSSSTFSHTVQAGTNRYVVVAWYGTENGTTPSKPSGVTWNSNAMTEIVSQENTNASLSFWGYAAGTSVSPTTANVVVTGASGTESQQHVGVNYQYIDQSTPVDDTYSATTNSSSGNTAETHSDQTLGIAVCGISERSSTSDADGTDRYSGNLYYYGDEQSYKGETGFAWTITGGGTNSSIASFTLNNSTAVSCTVSPVGVLPGFTGLTPGALYYLQNTRGTIDTSPGGTSVLVGKAVSATQILILH